MAELTRVIAGPVQDEEALRECVIRAYQDNVHGHRAPRAAAEEMLKQHFETRSRLFLHLRGQVIGCLEFSPWTPDTARGTLAYVEPEHRGRGYGRLMAFERLRLLRDAGFSQMFFEVVADDPSHVLSLYRGMQGVRTEIAVHPNGSPVVYPHVFDTPEGEQYVYAWYCRALEYSEVECDVPEEEDLSLSAQLFVPDADQIRSSRALAFKSVDDISSFASAWQDAFFEFDYTPMPDREWAFADDVMMAKTLERFFGVQRLLLNAHSPAPWEHDRVDARSFYPSG